MVRGVVGNTWWPCFASLVLSVKDMKKFSHENMLYLISKCQPKPGMDIDMPTGRKEIPPAVIWGTGLINQWCGIPAQA